MLEHIPVIDEDEVASGEITNGTTSNLRQIGPFRSLSAKRTKGTNQPRRVSFNDVPIIHEVPSFDLMRNSNCESHRAWTYTGSNSSNTPLNDSMTNILPSTFSTKLHANRISSAYYNNTSNVRNRPDLALNATVPSFGDTNTRLTEWMFRPKAPRIITTGTTDDTNGTNDSNSVSFNATSRLQVERNERSPSPMTPIIVVTSNDSKNQEYEMDLTETKSDNTTDITINNNINESITTSMLSDSPQKSIIHNNTSTLRYSLPHSVLYNNPYILNIASPSNTWKSISDPFGSAPSLVSSNDNEHNVNYTYRSVITPVISDSHHPMNVVSIPITTTSEQQQHPNNNQRNVSFGYSTQQQPSYVFRESTPSESSVVTYTSILSANIENSILSATSVQQQQPVIRNGRIRSATLPTAVRSTSNTNDISATNSTYNNVSITALTTQPSSTSTSLPITSTLPSRNFHTTTSTIVAPPPPTRISSAISSSSNILNRTVLRPTTIAFQCNTPYQTMPIVSQFSSKDSTVTNSSTGQQTPSSMKQMPIQKMPHNPRFMQRPNIPMTASSSTASIKHPVFANAMANSNIGENSANYLKASSTTTAAAAMQRARSANVFRRSPVDAFGNVTTLNNNLNTNSIKRNPNVRQTYGSYYMHRVLLPTTTN